MTVSDTQTASLRAGAAQVDITPRMGMQLAGDIGRYRPALLVADPLYARALVVESQVRKLCLVQLDLSTLMEAYVAEIRQAAADELGLDPAAIMVHCTQTHSAPALGHDMLSEACSLIPPELDWLRGGDRAYNPLAVRGILAAIRQANANLQPALVGAASGIEGRMAFNRRFVMRDGTVRTHPPHTDPNIRYREGPMDPELGVVCFTTEALDIVATLLHFTCHPTYGYPHRWVSADWPGAWGDGVREAYGQGIVPLVFNGCCGNIAFHDHLSPREQPDLGHMRALLCETTDGVVKRITYSNKAVVDWRLKRIPIPIRELPEAEMQQARDLLAQHPEPMWRDAEHTAIEWPWVYAVACLDLYETRKRNPIFQYEIQAFRIGDIALVGLPGEPFVEAQLEIKLKSPTYPTYVAHNCNMWGGYVPTRRAFDGGGYETRTANWSFLAPEALDVISGTALELLRAMF